MICGLRPRAVPLISSSRCLAGQPALPCRGRFCVGLIGAEPSRRLTTSTVSCAIRRYVVSLPPTIQTRPARLFSTTSLPHTSSPQCPVLPAGSVCKLVGEKCRCLNPASPPYRYLLVPNSIAHVSANYFPLFNNKRDNFSVVSDSRAVLRCGANNGHSEPGIVRLRIIVDEAIFQPISNKRRSQLHHLFTTQMTMPLNAAST